MDKKLIIKKEIRRLLSDFKYNVETRCCEDFTTGRKDLRILDTWLFTEELTYLESALNSLFHKEEQDDKKDMVGN